MIRRKNFEVEGGQAWKMRAQSWSVLSSWDSTVETVARKPGPATYRCIYSILSSEVGLTIVALRMSVKMVSAG